MLRHLLIFTSFLAGCAILMNENKNALRMREVDASVSELRTIVAAVIPVGLRAVSTNGREIVSRHFVITKDRYKPAADALERYFVQVTILGDRRPYDIEILVSHEKRVLREDRFTYVIVDYDQDLAREIEHKIRAELTKRRDGRNVIDDFRVF